MKKIVIIRGLVTSGKTTTSYELAKALPEWIFVDVWKIKEMFEPLGLKDRTPLKEISKKAMVLIMKEVIKTMKINIIVQETSQSFIKKNLSTEIKNDKYQVYSFFLDVNMEDAIKRDVQREKPTMDINKNNLSKEEWKKGRAEPEKEDFVINTSKHSVSEVVDIILNKIGEKRKKHPYANALRKSW